ncbi:MAG: hypothetical protein ACRELF_30425, partial [Gemmataceae bacterium]
VENAVAGHEIKSRALNTTIENDLIYEGPSGTASYSIDLPNGGNASITNNVIVKGPHSHNPGFIEYGVGGGLPGGSSLTIDGNTILSNYLGSARIINNYSTITAEFSNNQTYGVPDSRIASGPAAISGTTDLSTEPAVNLTPPWAQPGGVNWLTASDPLLTQSGVGIAGGSELLTVGVTGNHDTVTGGPGGVAATISGGNDVVSTMTHATDIIALVTGAIVSSAGADTIMALAGASTVSVSGSANIVQGAGSLAVNSKIQKEKGAYVWQDMRRQCRKYGLQWKQPSTFPRIGVLPSRIALLGADQPWIGGFCRQVMELNFVRDKDINQPGGTAPI